MNTKSSDNNFIPALLAVCAILTIVVCFVTAVPRVPGAPEASGAASESGTTDDGSAKIDASDSVMSLHEPETFPATTREDETALKLPRIIFPLDGRITSGFAWRDDPFFNAAADGEAYTEFHRGIDISAARSRDIRACADGVVCFTGSSTGYGNYLMIDHGDYVSLYAHCAEILAAEGDAVHAGDNIAVAGATGRATGPHLHFEIRVDGQVVDPLEYVGSVYAGVPN